MPRPLYRNLRQQVIGIRRPILGRLDLLQNLLHDTGSVSVDTIRSPDEIESRLPLPCDRSVQNRRKPILGDLALCLRRAGRFAGRMVKIFGQSIVQSVSGSAESTEFPVCLRTTEYALDRSASVLSPRIVLIRFIRVKRFRECLDESRIEWLWPGRLEIYFSAYSADSPGAGVK